MKRLYAFITILLLSAIIVVASIYTLKSSRFEQSVEKASRTETTFDSKSILQEESTVSEIGNTSYKENSSEATTFSESENAPEIGRQIVRLEVPQQVQRAWNTCSPTTVSMLLSYKGIDVSQETLAVEMGTDETFGTHNANAIAVLNQYLFGYATPSANQAGYRLETVTNPETDKSLFKERLRKNIADGYPMYYTIELSTLSTEKWGEHNVLGVGYQLNAEGTDIESVYYLDPSYVSQDPVYGGLKKVTVEELLYSTSVCVEPNYAW